MRALRYGAYGRVPQVVDLPDLTAPAGGVVVRVEASGICRSDWHAWRGHDPVELPHVPGHELAGTVESVGEGVGRWRPGQRVTAPFVCGCGQCDTCRDGEAQVCPHQTQPGFTGPGSLAEQVVVHAADTNLVALPDAIDAVAAASLGCRFATAFRALTAHARVVPGQWLAVHGCGGVGLSAVQIGAALGARVVAVDVSEAALARAAELGAEHVVDAASVSDAAVAVQEITGGGAHGSLDALGSPATAVSSVRSLRRRGRHVQIGLLLGPASTPPLPMDLVVAHELEVHGSHGMAARDYPPMLDLIAAGRVDPRRLVGAVIGLDDAGSALAAMDDVRARTAGITVVDLTGRAGR